MKIKFQPKHACFNANFNTIGAFFVLLITTCFLFSCSRDDDFQSNASSPAISTMSARNGKLSGFDNLANEYVNNVKTLMYASDAIELSPKELKSLEIEEGEDQNPMALKLNSLEILDENSGRDMNFYDLPLKQRKVFVDKLLDNEASNLVEKLKQIPEVAYNLSVENKLTSELIDELNLTKLDVGTESADNGGIINSNQPIKKVDSKMLFKKLNEKLFGNTDSEDSELGVNASFNYPRIPVERVKEAWRKYARKGDFIVALPIHHAPWSYLSVGKDVKFKVGHAGIISKNITHSTDVYTKDATIECHVEGGVQSKSISYWDTPHYIMGINKVRWRWRWRGFNSGFYREVIPVSNPRALADWAEGYRGRSYVRWYEFVTAKWAAPSRFTCTTLVWYSSKRVYNINISGWYSSLVTPSGLLTDPNTYIRKVVQ